MIWEREREEERRNMADDKSALFFFLFDRLTIIAILTDANDDDDYQIDHHNLSTLKTLKGCSHCLWWIRFDCLQLIDVVEWVWKIDDQNMHMHIWMNEWMVPFLWKSLLLLLLCQVSRCMPIGHHATVYLQLLNRIHLIWLGRLNHWTNTFNHFWFCVCVCIVYVCDFVCHHRLFIYISLCVNCSITNCFLNVGVDCKWPFIYCL